MRGVKDEEIGLGGIDGGRGQVGQLLHAVLAESVSEGLHLAEVVVNFRSGLHRDEYDVRAILQTVHGLIRGPMVVLEFLAALLVQLDQ